MGTEVRGKDTKMASRSFQGYLNLDVAMRVRRVFECHSSSVTRQKKRLKTTAVIYPKKS
jgi:hypothetical protein